MAYGRLIEYEGHMGERFRREVAYPAARRAAQARTTTAPAAPKQLPAPRPLWRRLVGTTA